MTNANLPARLRVGPPMIGTLVTLESPEAAEALAIAGMHWLFVDVEHSPTLDPAAVQRVTQAVAGRAYVVARVPAGSEDWIKRVLDSGADGVIVPHVKTAADAQRMIEAAKYPPLGRRSVGLARAQGYGADFAGYLARANDTTALILQVEDIEAVRNLDEILATPGFDAIFIGPYDLSGSMGKLGLITDPEVAEAIDLVRVACRKANMPLGVFATTAETIAEELDRGVNFAAIGTDLSLLANAAREALGRCGCGAD